MFPVASEAMTATGESGDGSMQVVPGVSGEQANGSRYFSCFPPCHAELPVCAARETNARIGLSQVSQSTASVLCRFASGVNDGLLVLFTGQVRAKPPPGPAQYPT